MSPIRVPNCSLANCPIQLELVETLLAAGANATILDFNGETALDIATTEPIRRRLREAQAGGTFKPLEILCHHSESPKRPRVR